MAAGVAPAAYHLWLDGDTLSHPEAGDSLSKRGNLPRHLVALGDGIFRKRVFTVIDMDIRAAHADAHDFDQYLTGLWLRDWNLPEFNDPRGCHNLLQHAFSSSFHSTTGGRQH